MASVNEGTTHWEGCDSVHPECAKKLDLVCGVCGSSLDYRLGLDGIPGNTYYVSPCELCREDTYSTAYEDGRSAGYDGGYDDGFDAADGR